MLSSAGNVLLLAFGFGFVIFWHELGHFLAAKWADVRVEQFAVGFGQAVVSWRKGLGFRFGSTQADYQARLSEQVERTMGGSLQFKEQAGGATAAQLDAAGRELGISDTEYRLNWIPLGGYVKMLGQDDMKPGEQVVDPRSYTSKPVGKRMVIVSAGVVMNVILAAIGFMVLFKVGYEVTAPTVGLVMPGSPAAMAYKVVGDRHVPAPIEPGDTILKIDGRWQADFDKIKLNTPLLYAGVPVPIEVKRANLAVETVMVAPEKATSDSEFPAFGIGPEHTLAAFDAKLVKEAPQRDATLQTDEPFLIRPGDTVAAVDGKPVAAGQYRALDEAIQGGGGRPVAVTIRDAAGNVRQASLPVHFAERFGGDPVNFGGLQMLTSVLELEPTSLVKGKVLPGDVVVDVADEDPSGGHRPMPTSEEFRSFVHAASEAGGKVVLTVMRGGKVLPTIGPVGFDRNHKVLGLGLSPAEGTPVAAEPADGSPAADARLPGGALLTAVDGRPVRNWFQIWAAVKAAKPGQPIAVAAVVDGQDRLFKLRGLTDAELDKIRGNRLTSLPVELLLEYAKKDRRATSSWEAVRWGVSETRDAIVQVKSTIMAMVHGSISPKEISGPLGILAVGYKFAEAGSGRLLWFLSIISANLAVMNFLPIPVVDGGLFTFLLIEKLKGSPVSQKAQVAAQYVGLTLLLSVFLFATWQDLFRLPMLFHG